MHNDSAMFGVLHVVKYIGSVIARDGGLFLGVRLVRQEITQWSGGPPCAILRAACPFSNLLSIPEARRRPFLSSISDGI